MLSVSHDSVLEILRDRVSRRQALGGVLGMAAMALTEDAAAKKRKKNRKKKKKATGCPGKQVTCDGQCRDLSSDIEHCGECYESCDEGQVCEASTCTVPCGEFVCLRVQNEDDRDFTSVASMTDGNLATLADDQVVIMDASGRAVKVIGEFGTEAGEFRYPNDIAVGSDNALYVADSGNDRIQILRVNGEIDVFPDDGASLIAVSPSDVLYTATYSAIRRMAVTGQVEYEWGPDGTSQTSFDGLYGLAVDTGGDVFVMDGDAGLLYRFSDNGAGNIERRWVVGGIGVDPGEFRDAEGITISGEKVFVADTSNRRIQVFNASSGAFIRSFLITNRRGYQLGCDDLAVAANGMLFAVDFDFYGYTLKS